MVARKSIKKVISLLLALVFVSTNTVYSAENLTLRVPLAGGGGRLEEIGRALNGRDAGARNRRGEKRPVWFFDDRVQAGEEEPTKDNLGGKGIVLREMTQAGLPVPPGYTITTEVCNTYLAGRLTDDGLMSLNRKSIAKLEAKTGKKFGESDRPLIVAVRSGAKFSMPGMMDTVLNVGLNDETVKGFAASTSNPRLAYDSYRRLIQMFGKVVLGVDGKLFENAISAKKKERDVKNDTKLSASDWNDLAEEFKEIIRKEGKEFPQDPYTQIHLATQAVFKSWLGARAKEYRSIYEIPE
ncbi:MAG: hypothetical protein KKF39_07130, partial [Nanoarchaeota archaeon]|nr:hypothetical protein [Nanoarchaeota archaeon]